MVQQNKNKTFLLLQHLFYFIAQETTPVHDTIIIIIIYEFLVHLLQSEHRCIT